MVTYLKADNVNPGIAVTNPSAGTGVNGDWTISGTWSDDWSGVKTVYISYYAAMTDGAMNTNYDTEAELEAAVAITPTLNKWIKISGPTAAWNYIYDTAIITAGQVDRYNLYVAAVDCRQCQLHKHQLQY